MTFLRSPVVLTVLGLTFAGCALPNTMPSFSTTIRAARAPAPPASVTAQLRALGTTGPGLGGNAERDNATDQTRVSVTTHSGSYFLWTQHPRITFFYVYAGPAPQHAPPSVFLVFRTHDPQAPSTNRLVLKCGAEEQAANAVPEFTLESGPIITDRVFTFELPLATFVQFASCMGGVVRVGDISASFGPQETARLRTFAGGMPGVPEP